MIRVRITEKTEEVIVKTGDFVKDTQAGYYRQERNQKSAIPTTWNADFRAYLLEQGVPEKYVDKVAYYSYEHGHAYGEEEILNHSYGLVEIFQEN